MLLKYFLKGLFFEVSKESIIEDLPLPLGPMIPKIREPMGRTSSDLMSWLSWAFISADRG